VNIGNPDELTMKALAEEIIDLTGSSSKVVYRPLPEDDPKVRQPDITTAQRMLGWEPKVDRRAGLKRTIEYFRSALGIDA
jgi:dTDP-glucose 4,6-dehydratase